METQEPDNQNERWRLLAIDLHNNNIETFYAVHSRGHSDGWQGALLSLRNLIRDRLKEFQKEMNNPEIEPEILAELLHAQNGMAAVFSMIDELEK